MKLRQEKGRMMVAAASRLTEAMVTLEYIRIVMARGPSSQGSRRALECRAEGAL